ncbi:hypothetical protein BDQ12DRAFT_682545 [Crucibulum laeve]|uniref:Uncharacterized protein n=1 Tax=Crucibulum laeve TaxID=68775 RepID=A0A5C3MDV9_9AGAR|nr:hypothetical protein BDQ12DRAFT_682545 [Crucibulum laeve]
MWTRRGTTLHACLLRAMHAAMCDRVVSCRGEAGFRVVLVLVILSAMPMLLLITIEEYRIPHSPRHAMPCLTRGILHSLHRLRCVFAHGVLPLVSTCKCSHPNHGGGVFVLTIHASCSFIPFFSFATPLLVFAIRDRPAHAKYGAGAGGM